MSASRLVHGAVTVSSEARARTVFEELLGLERIKQGKAGAELTRALFGMDGEAGLLLYDAGASTIEVFVWPSRPAREPTYDHLCLAADDLHELAGRAERLGLEVRRFRKASGEVVFVRDLDGNLFELKPA